MQVELINALPEDELITVYRCGLLVDLCQGPHIPDTAFVRAFACLKVMCAVSDLFSFSFCSMAYNSCCNLSTVKWYNLGLLC